MTLKYYHIQVLHFQSELKPEKPTVCLFFFCYFILFFFRSNVKNVNVKKLIFKFHNIPQKEILPVVFCLLWPF